MLLRSDLQGVILAAGKGTRLHPITASRSKAMLPILGRPMVELVMESLCLHAGVCEFVLVTSDDDPDIREHFARYCSLGVEVELAVQPQRLGTANALACAAPFVDRDFFLAACDNLCPDQHIIDMAAAWRSSPDLDGILSVMPVDPETVSRTGIVDLDNGRVTRLLEKPRQEEAPTNIASLPLYIFTRRLLSYLPQVVPSVRGEYELQSAVQMLLNDGGHVRTVTAEGRMTLTRAEDLLAINRHYLLHDRVEPHVFPAAVGEGTQLLLPLRIEEGTVIGEGCSIGPRVYIERGCRIGADVVLKDVVVLRQTQVMAGTTATDQVLW